MSWMTRMLSENTISAKSNPPVISLSPGYGILWFSLALIWLANGILQLRPTLVLMTMQRFIQLHPNRDQLQIFADINRNWIHLFFAHPITFNLSLGFGQILIGLLLFWGYHRRAGQYVVVCALIFCMFIFVVDDGLHNVVTQTLFIGGAPGPSILMVFGLGLLLLPQKYFMQKRMKTIYQTLWWYYLLVQLSSFFIYVLFQHQHIRVQFSFMTTGHFATIISLGFPVVALAYDKIPRTFRKGYGVLLCLLLIYIWVLGQYDGLPADFAFELNSGPIILSFVAARVWSDISEGAKHTSARSFIN